MMVRTCETDQTVMPDTALPQKSDHERTAR